MSKKSLAPAPRLRNSEDKLYQACLDACIKGLERIPVDTRQARATANTNNNNTLNASVYTATPTPDRSTTPPATPQSATSLISPPATPRQKTSLPSALSPASEAAMNRAPLHGAPAHGHPPPVRSPPARGTPLGFGSQDARSNLAVQPAANAGSFKLKKTAVKIVGAAAPSISFRGVPATTFTVPTVGAAPVPEPVKAKPKEAEAPEPAKPVSKPAAAAVAPEPKPPKTEPPTTIGAGESALDEMFARLNARSLSVSSGAAKELSATRPEKAEFSFGEGSNTKTTPSEVLDSYTANLPATPVRTEHSIATAVASPPTREDQASSSKEEEPKGAIQLDSMSGLDLEQEYFRKAADYVRALPAGETVLVKSINTVSKKLRRSYATDTELSIADIEKITARYAFAIFNYINKVEKSAKPIAVADAKEALKGANGNLLYLYIKLVDDGYLALNDLNSISRLCNTILDILPNPEPKPAPVKPNAEPVVAKPSESKSLPKGPVDNLKAWPTQEKREALPAYRACILKGVSGVKSINQLQALVWGGRLESISLPTSGADWAVVRFLTPEACEKYFKATENGIEVQGDKKTVVFVEKQAAPSSINDVMRNCTEGDASRCVRATDAEDNWSDMLLMKLAKGKGTSKREVDRIKRGKTARGRYYIEFRFANIYHALQFKRQLMDDPEWEHCTIAYATDPCETARGIHYKDEDEDGSAAGSFA